jgi:transcription elongation GreA/GreB family factor
MGFDAELETVSRAKGGVTMAERVSKGSAVTVLREDGRNLHFRLVAPTEANIDEGKLSVTAPLGKELLGREAGEEFNFHAPGGPMRMKVLQVEPTSG